MTQINKLTSVDAVQSGDQLPIFSTTNGDARKTSASTLSTYIIGQIPTSPNTFSFQRELPSASGFAVAVNPPSVGANVHLVVQPVGSYATGTIVLPTKSLLVDQQVIRVTFGNGVTTLTVDRGAVAGELGLPTTIATGGFFTIVYIAAQDAWFRIG